MVVLGGGGLFLMSEVHLYGPTNLASPNSVREITLEATQEQIDVVLINSHWNATFRR